MEENRWLPPTNAGPRIPSRSTSGSSAGGSKEPGRFRSSCCQRACTYTCIPTPCPKDGAHDRTGCAAQDW
jgi:hypothetical protein